MPEYLGVIGALSGGPAVLADTDHMHFESATEVAVSDQPEGGTKWPSESRR
jgi:hypothetical protein